MSWSDHGANGAQGQKRDESNGDVAAVSQEVDYGAEQTPPHVDLFVSEPAALHVDSPDYRRSPLADKGDSPD